MALAWFRLYRETITDPKFSRLTGGQRHLWTVLLCLANDAGHVEMADGVCYTDMELASIAGISSEDVCDALEWYERLKMVSIDEYGIIINNWGKRQFQSDNSTERVRKHRMKRFRNVSATPPETDTDTDTETDKEHHSSSADERTGSIPFDEFWNLYPRKANKKRSQVAWKNLTISNQQKAMNALPYHIEYWVSDGRTLKTTPLPTTWINGERWNDEINSLGGTRSAHANEFDEEGNPLCP